jgi:uncharacterized NAD-dependent epimerase/dehydratase family protein
MKIAIIDSGIEITHQRFLNCTIKGISIVKDCEKYIKRTDFEDDLGHGTACASIIHKAVPDVELICIKITNKESITNEPALIQALEYILELGDIRIVNVSLGVATDSPNPRLSDVCELAYNKGIIIVAASNNDVNTSSYPSYYPWVIGVAAGRIKKGWEYGYSSDSQIEFIAKGSIQRVAWLGNKYKLVSGTSFAAPHLCAIIARILKAYPSLSYEELKNNLIKNALPDITPMNSSVKNLSEKSITIVDTKSTERIESLFCNSTRFSWIKKVGIFPISEKEMKQFIDFPNLCQGEICLLFDYPRTLNELKSRNEFTQSFISRIDDNFTFGDIDTLVLGYFQDNQWEGNIIYGQSLLRKAIESDLNFFVFDKNLYDNIIKVKSEKSKAYLPHVDMKLFRETFNLRYLGPIKCPILMLIGTSNIQGKFTAQLRIKEALKTEGYRVSHISTEPQGELFGADFCFPFGHKSTVRITSNDYLIFLRNVCKGIYHTNQPDIIITGSQGGLIPRQPLSETPYTPSINSLGFLYGILPDLIICAINPEDTLEHICNTVSVAQSYTKCRLLFYILSPCERTFTLLANNEVLSNNRYLNNADYEEKLEFFNKNLEKPVINILKAETSYIIKTIEDACS